MFQFVSSTPSSASLRRHRRPGRSRRLRPAHPACSERLQLAAAGDPARRRHGSGRPPGPGGPGPRPPAAVRPLDRPHRRAWRVPRRAARGRPVRRHGGRADGFHAEPLSVVLGSDEEREVRLSLHLSGVSESIVVSAAQVDVPLSRSADSVTRGRRQPDPDRGRSRRVADALQLVPGLSVAHNGGRGSVTSLFPRGGESDYTLVLVDGVRANAFGGGFDFSQLPIADVERIEVVRGPESALFGSDAIGAVVQIVTRRGGRPGAKGCSRAAAWGRRALAASTAGSHRAVELGGGGRARGERRLQGDCAGHRRARHQRRLAVEASLGQRRLACRSRHRPAPDARPTARARAGFPGPFGSNPLGVFTGVDRFSRGDTTTRSGGDHARCTPSRSAGFACSSARSSRPSTSDSDFTSTFGLSESRSRRETARTQTDVAARLAAARLGGRRVQGRARIEHLHHRRAPGAGADHPPRHRRLRRSTVPGGPPGSASRAACGSNRFAGMRSRRTCRRSSCGPALRPTPWSRSTRRSRRCTCWPARTRTAAGASSPVRPGCVRPPAPASVRPTRSRSPSPTTRISSPNAAAAPRLAWSRRSPAARSS